MSSKAERKRRKNRAKAIITLPGGEAVPQTQPKDSRRGRAEDARKTALQAQRISARPIRWAINTEGRQG